MNLNSNRPPKNESQCGVDWRRRRRVNTIVGVLIGCVGIVLTLLGASWIVVFLFTDFRQHHAPIMIPVGVVTLFLGILCVGGAFNVLSQESK